ncbi:hypothetical protein ACTXT7_008592 [Hymenolepis weldensis]
MGMVKESLVAIIPDHKLGPIISQLCKNIMNMYKPKDLETLRAAGAFDWSQAFISHSLQPLSMPYFSQQTSMELVSQMNRSAGSIYLPHGCQIQNPRGQGPAKRKRTDDPYKIPSIPSTVTPCLSLDTHNLQLIQQPKIPLQEISNPNANPQYVKHLILLD